MDDLPLEKIIRSRRRTVALIITPEARLIVRAPLRAPLEVIHAAIQEKESWIRKKLAEMKTRPQATVHLYEEGEIFYFLGRPYPLHIVDDSRAAIVRTDRLCISRSLGGEMSQWIKRWYVLEAEKEIRSRCMWFSMTTGYSPASVRISDARGRWGSCTSRGGLNFSWRLIQAPLEIVDYVIVHELVHLAHHDHSRRFWDRVREIMPDYDRRRKWLRENERLLRI